MRAVARQDQVTVRGELAVRAVGEGFATAVVWLSRLPGRWWAGWQRVPRALGADDPVRFTSQR